MREAQGETRYNLGRYYVIIMKANYDMIVIGAGINGLVTASYLAKAGLKVIVLERREAIGGSAVTEEFYPGFWVDTCAHSAGWLNPKIAHDLELGRQGLTIVHPDPSVFTPLSDGGHLTLWRDVEKSAEAIRKFSKADAGKWASFSTRMSRLAGFLETVYAITLPRITTTDFADALTALSLGRRLRGLGKTDMIELVRTLPMSAAELLDDWFESDALKGTLGASGITGILQGPRSGGTAFVMLHHHVGSQAGSVRDDGGRVRGGIGNLAKTLAAAAQGLGAQIRTGAEVAQIVIKEDRAAGVALTSGEEIAAGRIISSVDPKRTFFHLMDPLNLEPKFLRQVQNIKFRGACAKVNLALGELPQFDGTDAAHWRGVISISPSLEYLERAYDDAKYGGVSREPYLEARIPTLADPALAPAGKHVMSILVHYAPYHLREGQWDDARRAALGDAVIDTLAGYAPNLKPAILHRQVLTPLDLENTYGLTEGNLYQGELTLDQVLFMRPAPGWGQCQTPIQSLYLCGAGTHPGGGIAGGSGFNAAREILKDVKRKG
jgi:phytoene dehydrogenase-like protein